MLDKFQNMQFAQYFCMISRPGNVCSHFNPQVHKSYPQFLREKHSIFRLSTELSTLSTISFMVRALVKMYFLFRHLYKINMMIRRLSYFKESEHYAGFSDINRIISDKYIIFQKSTWKSVMIMLYFYYKTRQINVLYLSEKRQPMRYNIRGKGTKVTDGLRSAVEEKIGKLDHYFKPDTLVNVTLNVENDRQKIEVTIPVKGHIIRAEQESDDMYVSIDLVEDIIERQMRRYKTKLIDSKQNAADFSKEYIDEDDDDEEIKITRTKKFAVKPMDPEEACVQMELLNHSFYVFRNAETEEVNVVYKKKDGTFGLIEPELG